MPGGSPRGLSSTPLSSYTCRAPMMLQREGDGDPVFPGAEPPDLQGPSCTHSPLIRTRTGLRTFLRTGHGRLGGEGVEPTARPP